VVWEAGQGWCGSPAHIPRRTKACRRRLPASAALALPAAPDAWRWASSGRTVVMLELLMAMLFALVLLNIWATWRAYDDLSTPLQKVALVALIWVLPVLGALLVLHMLRQHPERRSGHYPGEPDPGDDFGYSRKRVRRTEDAGEGDAASSDAGASSDCST
jgi:hypothetical protein